MKIDELIEQYGTGRRDFSNETITFDYAIYDTILKNINLSQATLIDVRLIGVDLSGANLTQANLSHASLRQVNLEKAKLEGTNFVGASLEDVNLSGAIYDPNKTLLPLGFDPSQYGAVSTQPPIPPTPPQPEPPLIPIIPEVPQPEPAVMESTFYGTQPVTAPEPNPPTQPVYIPQPNLNSSSSRPGNTNSNIIVIVLLSILAGAGVAGAIITTTLMGQRQTTTVPTSSNTPNSTSAPSPEKLADQAYLLIDKYYAYVSVGNFVAADNLLSQQMRELTSPRDRQSFFEQFSRVTVNNLTLISQSTNTVNLKGDTTYVWHDGSIQREERTFTVRYTNGEIVMTGTEFIKVTYPRR